MEGRTIKTPMNYKRILTFSISLFLLTILYKSNSWVDIKLAIDRSNPIWICIAMGLVVPIAILTSWRYKVFAKKFKISPCPRMSSSLKSYFIAAIINLFVPSKLGDLSKGMICERLESRSFPASIHVFTLYEKIVDLYSVLLITLFSHIIVTIRVADGQNIIAKNLYDMYENRIFSLCFYGLLILISCCLHPKLLGILNAVFKRVAPNYSGKIQLFFERVGSIDLILFIMVSIFIWLLHISQIIIFSLSLGIDLASVQGSLVITTTILIGLIPISFAGIGTRDGVLLYFLSGYASNSSILLLGTLFTSRYIIPALIGIPLLINIKIPKKLESIKSHE